MSYDADYLKEALKDIYFQHLIRLRDELIDSDTVNPTAIAKLRDEMNKTGMMDGFILKWKDKVVEDIN